MKKRQQNIGIITPPLINAGVPPLSNLINILQHFLGSIYIITGNEGIKLSNENDQKIHILGIQYKSGANTVSKIVNHVYLQLRISLKLIKLTKNVDTWVFFLDAHALLLPVLTAKLMRKKIIFALAASLTKSAKVTKNTLANVLVYSEAINYKLSTHIILYSENLIKDWNLEKYRNKISIAHEHFLDVDKFKIQKKFEERDNLVGYIGRLSEEKGVLNFVKSIPEVLKERSEIKFLMGGDGTLRAEIEKYLDENDSKSKVKLTGWIPHDELPEYLNELKLVVLPSYTEGLPNVMLEGMACGTPVLATPVGAIPDVIKDSKTGFIMENNSPECIAKNAERVLNYPNLDKIVKNARELVEREFAYEATVERYKKILENIRWRKND